MTVHFIGAGPGAADLLTLRGRDLIASCPVCLYAGSLIPDGVLEHVPADARRVDTARMALDDIIEEMRAATAAGKDVARLQSGDLAVYSALGEQLRRLQALDIPYTMTPGVPAFSACAATLGQELTLPEVGQSLVLTRTQGRASSMPPTETLENFACSRATLAIHLSLHAIDDVVARLTPHYGSDCPAAIVLRASWPEEQVLRGTLADIAEQAHALPERRSALILVGRVLASADFRESALYDPKHVGRIYMTDAE
ncbi:MAG: precorrin-4 C(11)-methyltransferase [Halofilum sp. (in: g-proteobacteria)]|nr:precorrin-4 C(11)-methyltransferase [Halofilum sp. (in: g-proteobacteria)]